MTQDKKHRIIRPATKAEKERHEIARKHIESELPEIKLKGRAILERIRREGTQTEE